MRCIECEEIELARVRDQRPTQTLPIPYQAHGRLPGGAYAVAPDPPPADAVGRRGRRIGLRGQGTRLGADLGVRRRGGRRAGEEVRRPALPGGRQRRPQHRPARAAARTTPPTSTRGRSSIAARAPTRRRPCRLVADARPGGRGAGVRQRHGLRRRQQRRHGRASTRSSATAPAALAPTSRSCPRSTPRSTRSRHFDNSDLWFEASADLNNKTGWLGRWIDRNGDANNPLQAVSLDTALSKAIRTTTMPVSRDQLAADDRLQADRQPAALRVQQHAGLERGGPQAHARSRCGAGNAYLARSRATYGLTYKTSLLAGGAYAPPAGSYPTTTPTGRR